MSKRKRSSREVRRERIRKQVVTEKRSPTKQPRVVPGVGIGDTWLSPGTADLAVGHLRTVAVNLTPLWAVVVVLNQALSGNQPSSLIVPSAQMVGCLKYLELEAELIEHARLFFVRMTTSTLQ